MRHVAAVDNGATPSRKQMDEERRLRRQGPNDRPGTLGGKRDLNRRKRVLDLVDAGLSLFLERGIETVTIDQVARAAGMAKGNFYRYFQNTADLVEATIEPVATSLRSAITACDEKLRHAKSSEDTLAANSELGARVAMVLVVHARPARLYLQERRSPSTPDRLAVIELAEELERSAVAISQIAVDRGLLHLNDPRVSALAVMGAVESLAVASLQGRFDLDLLKTGKILIDFVVEGLRAK